MNKKKNWLDIGAYSSAEASQPKAGEREAFLLRVDTAPGYEDMRDIEEQAYTMHKKESGKLSSADLIEIQQAVHDRVLAMIKFACRHDFNNVGAQLRTIETLFGVRSLIAKHAHEIVRTFRSSGGEEA